MEIRVYKNYNDGIEVDIDTVLVSLWNAYLEGEDRRYDNRIYVNDKDFFVNTFENSYDAAWSVSLSGKWAWSDDYVYFDEDGCLTSFSHWDDENSPIDLDKLDISQLINSLEKHKKRYVVDNIPKAIHEALQE